jgi:formate dehydrogenase major subunit
MSTFQITIDHKNCTFEKGQTILDVAKANNIEIPTLCHHPLVKTYGACGICLVEDENSPKLYRACATEASEKMVIHTNGKRAEDARKTALELLFSDHRGDCRPPCTLACPGHTDCQVYTGLIGNGKYKEALRVIKRVIPLPACIGRVCPHPCEDACRRQLVEEPIAIAELKSFAADMDLLSDDRFIEEIPEPTGKKITVIGGGPAGLTAAYFLALKGHSVEIIEAMPHAGGMLRYGIPQYRLPKEILDKEIENIARLGVTFRYNTRVGKDVTFGELKENSNAVYVAIGAWQSAPMRCIGEEAEGVLGGIDFLIAVAQGEKPYLGKTVAVVGGGNTAMDACRTAIRMGAQKVYVLYRRTENEMPAEKLEIKEAREEGVEFRFLVAPTEVLTENNKVKAIRLQQMELGEPDASGRRRPVPIKGALEDLPLDTIIAAIGQKVIADGIPVGLTDWNTIKVDEHTFLTDQKGVFAGGDGINKGPGIAIEAIADANRAADVIDSYLKGDIIPYTEPFLSKIKEVTAEDLADREKLPRHNSKRLDPKIRKGNFDEVFLGLTEEEAVSEGRRCLECGCADYYECKLIRYGQKYMLAENSFGDTVRKRNIADNNPYIDRDSDKCILCGLCVRVCEEVVGKGVWGLVNRGFETIIQTEFNIPLAESDCITCGQCINVCPTGALTEKQVIGKRIPIKEKTIDNSCGQCSINCKTKVLTFGNHICRVIPREETGLLCKKGKFGYETVLGGKRVTSPVVEGKETTYAKATAAFKEKLHNYDKNKIGVFLAPNLSKEEVAAYVDFAHHTLNTEIIASPAALTYGVKGDAKLADIENAKHIVYIGGDPYTDNPVAGIRMAKSDAKISCFAKDEKITVEKDTDLIIVAEKSADAKICVKAAGLAKSIGAKLLILHAFANTHIYRGAGVKTPEILNSRLKALVVIGDEDGIPLKVTNLFMIAPRHTSLTKEAKIVFPFATNFETAGTVACNCGAEYHREQVIRPVGGKGNLELLDLLK